MALSHDNQLNLISPDNNNDYGYFFSMSKPANGGGSDAAYDGGGLNVQTAWASDVPSTMPNVTVQGTSGGADTFDDAYNITYAHEVYRDATFADMLSDKNQAQYAGTNSDNDNGTANSAAMKRPMGVQASIGFVEEESEIKVEGEDKVHPEVSSTPSYPGGYDEYDESDDSDEGSFEGSRAKTIPKTNKDGARRKPRQPRAKLLKWSDNDWKNVVLGIIWACGETGTQIPFDQAAQIVGESCTAGALQQAVLKLRQKQVAEGNWIPSLRMAWTRKSKNSDSSLFNANDTKISKDVGKAKTMLPKKRATRFCGNQSLIVTLKRAYREADRQHLGKIVVVATKIHDALTSPFLRASASSLRRANELSLAEQKARDTNRKARVSDSVLMQYSPLESPTHMPTPALTPSSAYRTEFGTPITDDGPSNEYNEFVMVSRGGLLWTPANTVAANNAVAHRLGSRALNPQGYMQYTPYSMVVDPSTPVNVMNCDTGEGYRADNPILQAQAGLNATRGDTKIDNSFYVPAPAEDPFTPY